MYKIEGEKPLDNLKNDGGLTCIFRSIGCIGDSLASGEHESYNDEGVTGWHDYYEYSWGQYIARSCGLKAYNFSKGGLKASTFHQMDKEWNCFEPNKFCQAYIIALGVNDLANLKDYPDGFGTIDDVDFNDYNNNKKSFVGEYVKIIQKIREFTPKARIFVVTIPIGSSETVESMELRDKHAEFLNTLDKYFEFLYCIDLRKYDRVYDKEFYAENGCGGHLNAIGYKYSAVVISSYIDYIIRNNIDDFKQVGFIGKDVHNVTEKW